MNGLDNGNLHADDLTVHVIAYDWVAMRALWLNGHEGLMFDLPWWLMVEHIMYVECIMLKYNVLIEIALYIRYHEYGEDKRKIVHPKR